MNDEQYYTRLTTPTTSAPAVSSSVERRRRLTCLPQLDDANEFVACESTVSCSHLIRTSLPAATRRHSVAVSSESSRLTDPPSSLDHSASTDKATPPLRNRADTLIAATSCTMLPDSDGASSVDSARALVLVSGLPPHASDDLFKQALSVVLARYGVSCACRTCQHNVL